MDNDGPVTAVQVRLAKGEISTAQYKEILSHLMKNISSFQQTSSLKIIQMRYAKSEITSEQYREYFTTLMKNLYLHPWSPPLHILHVRYAEGEIDTSRYEEMFTHLTQEQFAYDQSTPLWILNNRYAKGDLTTPEYEEILSLFNEYTLSLKQSAIKMPGDPGKKFQELPGKSSPPDLKIAASAALAGHPEKIREKEPVQEPGVSDAGGIRYDELQNGVDDDEEEKHFQASISSITSKSMQESSPSGSIRIQPGIRTDIDIGKELSEELQDIDTAGSGVDMSGARLPDLVTSTPPATDTAEKSTMPSDLLTIPELKTHEMFTPDIHSFPSTMTQSMATGSEALPSDFLSLGVKQKTVNPMGYDDAGALTQAEEGDPEYSVENMASSAVTGPTDETDTSEVINPEDVPGLTDPDSLVIPASGRETDKSLPGSPLIRQKVKKLIRDGNYQEALDLAKTMIGPDDTDYVPYFYMGMARYYLNIHEDALADLDRARELCSNKDDLRKIETIRNRITSKKHDEAADDGSASAGEETLVLEETSPAQPEPEPEMPDEISEKLDALGKKAQDLIYKKDYKSAGTVLKEFLDNCAGFSNERLLAESADEIYAAQGYVRYQLKDYLSAKESFQKSLAINGDNEISNHYIKDILIRAARKK
jgi:uncharacterized membrane protein/tetratricopeptide (TPR) repeat protein